MPNVIVKRAWPYEERLPEDWKNFSGFFHQSWRVDRHGLWADCSLNSDEGKRVWRSYEPPQPAIDLLRRPKYDQAGASITWPGVVLAAQNGGTAISHVTPSGTNAEYWSFVWDACKYFGKNLCIKLHPRVPRVEGNIHEEAAKTYGASIGHFSQTIYERCEFVLVFNSNSAVDAWLAGKDVMQYAPGCFAQTGAVTFTDGKFLTYTNPRLDIARQLLEFCAWRYNFSIAMSTRKMELIKDLYRANGSMFPLTEELSYAQRLIDGWTL